MAYTSSTFFTSSSSSSLTLHRSRLLASDFTPLLPPHNSYNFIFSPTPRKFSEHRIALATKKNILYASTNGTNAVSSTSLKYDQDGDYIPMPIVLIDQDSNSDATIVQLSFGDRLGALIDTMKALKDLGLDVAKGTVITDGSVKQTKFFITRLNCTRAHALSDVVLSHEFSHLLLELFGLFRIALIGWPIWNGSSRYKVYLMFNASNGWQPMWYDVIQDPQHHTRSAHEDMQGSQDYASKTKDARIKMDAQEELVAEEAKRDASSSRNNATKVQDPLSLPAGPFTRGRARLFKNALSVFISALEANGAKPSVEANEGLGLTSMIKLLEEAP